jgi:hypothetical protein
MSKLKAIDPKMAEPKKPKIVLFGKAGVGKTWASLDFPNVYYIDAEGGATLEHYTDKLKKSNGVYLGQAQGANSFVEVIEQIKALATEKHNYKTVVIDSLSKLYNNEIQKSAEILGDKDVYGASKKDAIKLTRQLINWVEKIDMNVVLICHEKSVWENGEQAGIIFDAWDKINHDLDLCLNIVMHGTSRKAIIYKSRIKSMPQSDRFDWSFANFAEKYGHDVLYKDVNQFECAVPGEVAELKRLIELLKIDDKKVKDWLEANKSESIEEVNRACVQDKITALRSKIDNKG